MLIATGRAALPEVTQASGALFAALKQAVLEVSMELAQAIVRDGEGATKFVTVQVNGGATHQECLDVGYAVAHSPLIKTALFASDPNWGRILAAVGRAGVANLDVSKIDVFLGDVCIASRGGRAASYTEEQGAAVMAQAEIGIRIELGTRHLQRDHLDHRPVPRIREDQRRVPHLKPGIPILHRWMKIGNLPSVRAPLSSLVHGRPRRAAEEERRMALTIVIGNRNDSSWSLRGLAGPAHERGGVRRDPRPAGAARYPGADPAIFADRQGALAEKRGWRHLGFLAIAEYLAERFLEAHLWPRGEAARALARSVCAEMHSGCRVARRAADGPRRQQPLVELSEATRQDIQRIWRSLGGLPAALRARRSVPVRPRQPGGCVLRTGGGAFPQLCGGIAGYRPDLCRDDLSVACVPRLVRRGIARAGRKLMAVRRFRRCVTAVARR